MSNSNIFTTMSSTPQEFSTFDLSHQNMLTMKQGALVPILLQECVPGDRFNIAHNQMVRMQPMLAPIMTEVGVQTYFFFVPHRILYDEKYGSDKTNPWVQFIRGGDDGVTIKPLPHLASIPLNALSDQLDVMETIGTSSLWDYLGLPAYTNLNDDIPWDQQVTPNNILLQPFMAYHKVWNDYFRYESIQPEFDFLQHLKIGVNNFTDIDNNPSFFKELFSLKYKAWEHDKFTSALPSPQRGAPVTLPIYGQAPLRYDHNLGNTKFNDNATGTPIDTGSYVGYGVLNESGYLQNDSFVDVNITDNHYVDLSGAVATTVQDFRKAIKLQEWLEIGMRSGTRYFEFIQAYAGIHVQDARLQRSEFIGGSKNTILISEVLQTAQDPNGVSPLADMAGHGINIGNSKGSFAKFVEEYGYIIGLACILPRTNYKNNVPKLFQKLDKFDYFTAQFQHVGEQAIENQEVNYNWLQSASELNEDTFGYIPRYSDYKFENNKIHGDFANNLNHWVWTRNFSPFESIPLDAPFIESRIGNDIFAVELQTSDHFLCHFNFNISAKRQMNYLGEPKLA